jgi:predicted metal-dependent hydrolase
MDNFLHIGQLKIPYEIKRSKQRSNMKVVMDKSQELEVRVPDRLSRNEINEKLDEKKEWVLQQFSDLSQLADKPREKDYMSGEKLRYNGRRYYLRVKEREEGDPQIEFSGSDFRMLVPVFDDEKERRQACHEVVLDWYEGQAKTELETRVKKFSERMNARPSQVSVESLEQMWGRHKGGNISLHWRLVLAPASIQDYVVVHELAHLKEGGHSRSFWNTVGSIIPDYEDRIEWLRVNGNKLQI